MFQRKHTYQIEKFEKRFILSWRMCPSVYYCLLKIEKKLYASNHTYTLRRQKPSHALKLVLLLYACINLWVRRSLSCWPRRIGVLIYNFSNDEASVLRTKTSRGFPLLRVMPHLSPCIHAQVHIIAWFALLPTIHWCENRLTTQFCVPPILVWKSVIIAFFRKV